MTKQSLEGFALIAMMLLGALLGEHLAWASPAIPWLISGMLFLTFLDVRGRDLRLRVTHFLLSILQSALALLVYFLCLGLGRELALSGLICVLMPAATASPVVVRLLGGDVGYTTSYVLLSHIALILFAPLLLPSLGVGDSMMDWGSLSRSILIEVSKLILPPLILAQTVRICVPKLRDWLGTKRGCSYKLWMLSLVLLIAQAMTMLQAQARGSWDLILAVGAVGCLLAVLQFVGGCVLGRYLAVDSLTLRHCLGQKNTTLGLWLSMLFLPHVVAFACTAYILAQNLIMTYLIARSLRGHH